MTAGRRFLLNGGVDHSGGSRAMSARFRDMHRYRPDGGRVNDGRGIRPRRDPTAEHLPGIAIQARQRTGTPGGAPRATPQGCIPPAFPSHRLPARVPCTQMRGTT